MYASRPTLQEKHERLTAGLAVLAVHILLMAALIAGLAFQRPRPDNRRLVAFNLLSDVPPPPPPAVRAVTPAERNPGAAAPAAEPSEEVAPRPVVALPRRRAAPAIAGEGAAATSGAAEAGSGTGAGGSGTGAGGGGTGEGLALGAEAQLITGGLNRRDYRSLGFGGAPNGSARVALTVGTEGRLIACQVANTSGDPQVDATICTLLTQRMVWNPARDRAGKPMPVRVFYVATWQRN
ncbi:hypothetical protein HMF7854_03700 [Sphingomonas ginkgonis]|uniref:Energy transducer TonB n=1 Tax=Sphingomonas ginkgonis TaxID=2315330 RepID=A0A3R9YKS2_9SPHN|nr:hypothetical protein [Sphingomonas ginkgonis]RST30031.1 hypothetical protein HMF7854_03700 [Sphingomonas ginkgonis]